VELQALELTQLRVLSAASAGKGNKPDPVSSILKIKGSEIQQATTELAMQAGGPMALAGADTADWASLIAPTYLNWRKVSIYGGSNEIQKTIIARAVLGL
jgi:alkylation response protein AidB-like acyl-CoA dehydrogenase